MGSEQALQTSDQEPAGSFSLELGGGAHSRLEASASDPLCLDVSNTLCADWGPRTISSAQLQSLLQDTVCPCLLHRTEHRFQHMAPEGRHPHCTFPSKTNAYQTPTPPGNTLLGSAHPRNPKLTGTTSIPRCCPHHNVAPWPLIYHLSISRQFPALEAAHY